MRKFGMLSGLQRGALGQAIQSMFPGGHPELSMFLVHSDFGPLSNYAAANDDLPLAISKLVEKLYARGRLDELFVALETDPDLASSHELVDLNSRIDVLSPRLATAVRQIKGSLEAMVAEAGFDSPFLWTGRLAEYSRSVCRIRVNTPDGATVLNYGSGFLIAPDRVLTAYHVIEPAQAGSQILVTFGYAEDRSGPLPAHNCGLAASWLGTNSRYAPGEELGKDVVPTADELDFAVLHLLQPVPDNIATPVDVGTAAGDAPTTIIILQHPLGGQLQMSIGAVIDTTVPHRLRYGGDAKGGASGGLVLNSSLTPVAIHHFGSEDAGNRYNQGVPLREIVASIGPTGG